MDDGQDVRNAVNDVMRAGALQLRRGFGPPCSEGIPRERLGVGKRKAEDVAGHRDAHARWRAGADEMHRAGVLMRKAAQRAHDNYAAAADANEQMWQQAR